MDIHVPPKGSGPFPVLIWFGGLWKPAKLVPDLNHFFSHGVAVVGVQMRTMSDAMKDKVAAPVSYVMDDACRAVQFVRLNAAKWNLDQQRIAVGGGSQGTLPALYVGCAGDRANPQATDPVGRVSTKVTCVAAYRSQPSIDPKRMQEWVPNVQWGVPALECSFAESLKRREELMPLIKMWSPDWLLHKDAAPIYFENNWGLTRPEDIKEMDYKVHSPAWALGFQKLAQQAGVVCHVKFPEHPTAGYTDIWDFIVQQLRIPAIQQRQVIILKLDDVKQVKNGTVHRSWQRVADYIEANHLKASFGIICSSLEKDNPAYFDWIKTMNKKGFIEFWLHGYRDRTAADKTGEFEQGTFEEQKAVFEKCERLAMEKLGFTLPAFGPHWSGTTDATEKALDVVPEIRIWLYGPKNPKFYKKASFERVMALENPTFLPDFEKFKTVYERIGVKEKFLVLQGHPPNWWKEERWNGFFQIVEFLRAKGCVFMTPSECACPH